MIELEQKLQNIGLSERESKVYLFLLQYQESKASILCSKLNIKSAHIYTILEKLITKGIVSFKIVNNVKFFYAAEPESLYSLFQKREEQLEREKKELKSFISSLEKIEVKKVRQNDFKYFEGIAGVKSMFTEFIASWKNNSQVCVSTAPLAYENWNAYLLEMFHPIRKERNILAKLIVPQRLRKHGEERKKFRPIEIRYSPDENPAEMGVAGDYVYFLSYGDKPYSLLVKDENLAATQVRLFEIQWNQLLH